MATRSIEDGHSTSSSPDLDWENKDAGVDSSFDSQVSLWTNEGLSLVDCVCGAPPESYCTCLPISMALSTDGDNDDYHHWQTWYSNSHSNSHSNISITETTTPTSSSLSPDTASAVPVTSVVRSSNRTKETEAPTRPQLTTRKEVRILHLSLIHVHSQPTHSLRVTYSVDDNRTARRRCGTGTSATASCTTHCTRSRR